MRVPIYGWEKYAACRQRQMVIAITTVIMAHRNLRITGAEFDEVAAELGRTLDALKVPQREKDEVLAAFAAHKGEVIAGSTAAKSRGDVSFRARC